MIIVGAKGLAAEILQILNELNYRKEIMFYDDVNLEEKDLIYDQYKILREKNQAKKEFEKNNNFILGLGNPKLRKKLYDKFTGFGGVNTGVWSKDLYIGKYLNISKDATLMSGVKISNNVQIGKALLAYYNVVITHDVRIGDFVELSPGCKLLGHVQIEDEVHVGSGAVILPRVKIGRGSIVGAGAVVTKDVLENTVVVGNPAKPK